MKKRMRGWVGEWMNGWLDGWMDRSRAGARHGARGCTTPGSTAGIHPIIPPSLHPLLPAVVLALQAAAPAAAAPAVHAVVDLAHEFSFYADGRFARQYLADQKAVTSWNALPRFDLSNANLLVLLDCAEPLAYTPEDRAAIRALLEAGGGVAVFVGADRGPQHDLAASFGARLVADAKKPLKIAADPGTAAIEGGARLRLELEAPAAWTVHVTDADGRPVVASRAEGKGRVLVAPRSLAGSRPDASDPINASWLAPLLVRTAAGRAIDPSKPFQGRGLVPGDTVETHEGLTLHYSDYLKPYARAMFDIAQRCRPVIGKRMGVPLSDGMASEVGLLATGGGGFSSGRVIGLAVWWGGFPERGDSMIEFITHESVHSWVLPFAEIWNEPIATYVGNLVMIDLGHGEEAERRIRATIARAARHDPEMRLYDLDGRGPAGAPALGDGARNDVHWGKSFWIFEQLRAEDPDWLARYFQAKRRLARPGALRRYGPDETVAVLSTALGRDLFPWFRAHGLDVAPDRSQIRPAE